MIKLVEIPAYVSLNQYEESILRMTDRLMSFKQVLSVYQMGSISAPGISDIDLVIVFKDGESCDFNPLANITQQEKYLFVHSLFGLNETQFINSNDFLLHVKYNLRAGKEIIQKPGTISAEQKKELNNQIALEYLVKNFITISIQQKLNVLKLHKLLLEANALKYDFELLNITDGRLYELVYELIDWRKKWFDSKPSDQKINLWFQEYCSQHFTLLQRLFHTHALYSPLPAPIKLNRNVYLGQSNNFALKKSGVALPMVYGVKPITIFKIANRLNSFKLLLPLKFPGEESIQHKRFSFLQDLRHYNTKHLPHFMPLVSVLPFIK